MIWRWILGILALLILLLCWTRAGVLVTLEDAVRVDVKLGWLRIQIVPGKKKATKAKKPKKATEKNAEGKEKKRSFSKPAFADIQDALKTLGPPLKKALGRTRRGIRIDPLRLSLAIGGREDPAAAAKLYGEINAAVWAGMPMLEQMLDIPDARIHTETDFDMEETRAEGTLGVTLRIGTVLVIGVGIAVPTLRWFLRYMRKHRKKQLPAPEKARAA